MTMRSSASASLLTLPSNSAPPAFSRRRIVSESNVSHNAYKDYDYDCSLMTAEHREMLLRDWHLERRQLQMENERLTKLLNDAHQHIWILRNQQLQQQQQPSLQSDNDDDNASSVSSNACTIQAGSSSRRKLLIQQQQQTSSGRGGAVALDSSTNQNRNRKLSFRGVGCMEWVLLLTWSCRDKRRTDNGKHDHCHHHDEQVTLRHQAQDESSVLPAWSSTSTSSHSTPRTMDGDAHHQDSAKDAVIVEIPKTQKGLKPTMRHSNSMVAKYFLRTAKGASSSSDDTGTTTDATSLAEF